jgi:hypothetical protein
VVLVLYGACAGLILTLVLLGGRPQVGAVPGATDSALVTRTRSAMGASTASPLVTTPTPTSVVAAMSASPSWLPSILTQADVPAGLVLDPHASGPVDEPFPGVQEAYRLTFNRRQADIPNGSRTTISPIDASIESIRVVLSRGPGLPWDEGYLNDMVRSSQDGRMDMAFDDGASAVAPIQFAAPSVGEYRSAYGILVRFDKYAEAMAVVFFVRYGLLGELTVRASGEGIPIDQAVRLARLVDARIIAGRPE